MSHDIRDCEARLDALEAMLAKLKTAKPVDADWTAGGEIRPDR